MVTLTARSYTVRCRLPVPTTPTVECCVVLAFMVDVLPYVLTVPDVELVPVGTEPKMG